MKHTKKKVMAKKERSDGRVPKNPNDHRIRTPDTSQDRSDETFTSYDTENPETDSPQKARESRESPKEMERKRKQS